MSKYRPIRNLCFIVGFIAYYGVTAFRAIDMGEAITPFEYILIAVLWILVMIFMDFETTYYEKSQIEQVIKI